MKAYLAIDMPMIGLVCAGLWVGLAAAQDLPVVKGKKVVASVNGENITQEELSQEIASIKKGLSPGGRLDRRAELDVLKRLINTRLIVQEARTIGFDKLPENVKMLEVYSREALREELVERVGRDAKPEAAEIERLYKEAVREYKLSAVLCGKEDDAKRFEAELATGKAFDELAKTFKEQGRAKQVEEGVFVKLGDLDPAYRMAVSAMSEGSTSAIIQTKAGFAFLRLEDIRYGENPEERDKARQIALDKARGEAVRNLSESLRQKLVKVNREVLDSVNYEAQTPGFDVLLKDTRSVAEIKGDKPVTVGDLTEQIRFQFFHGLDRAAERKKLNARKEVALEGILYRRLFRLEALRLGLDKTDSYKSKVREREADILFGTFISKVIHPEIKVKEDELKAYYASHAKEFSAPDMIRIRALVFAKREDAEGAVEKLKRGAELQWLSAHAEGQVDKTAKGVLAFDGKLLTTLDLPDGIRKSVDGAKGGDFRLYASPEGHFYALAIQEVSPSRPRPYEEVRTEVAERVVKDKIARAVEEYAEKLRSASDVKIYLKG